MEKFRITIGSLPDRENLVDDQEEKKQIQKIYKGRDFLETTLQKLIE